MSGQQITVLIKYMIQAGETHDVKTLLYELARRVPEQGERLMTIAEQLKLMGRTEGLLQGMQEGIQQGIQEGLEQGLHQGILEGQRAARQEIARQMLLRASTSARSWT